MHSTFTQKKLPITLPEVISKPKQRLALLETPFDHFNYHVMKIVYTFAPNYLHKKCLLSLNYMQRESPN